MMAYLNNSSQNNIESSGEELYSIFIDCFLVKTSYYLLSYFLFI
jgi:hypothetical protein